MKQQTHLQRNDLEPTLRSVPVKIAIHVVCVFFTWLVDADGDLALIDPREPILEREKEKEKEGRIWSRSEGRLQRGPKADAQASSSSSKPITPIMVLKLTSIDDPPLLQHHNLISDLQDTLNPHQIT